LLQARCHSCRPTNSVKALKAILYAVNDFQFNVCVSLRKDVAERPNYDRLLEHPFIARETVENDEVLSFVKGTLLEFAKEFGLDFDDNS